MARRGPIASGLTVQLYEDVDAPVDTQRVTILDFWADWCGICRLIDPVVNRIVREREVPLLKVNVEEEAEVAKRHNVIALPTLLFLAEDGRELHRISGSMTGKQIEAALGSALAKAAG